MFYIAFAPWPCVPTDGSQGTEYWGLWSYGKINGGAGAELFVVGGDEAEAAVEAGEDEDADFALDVYIGW